MSIASPVFFWFPFAWNMFFHPLNIVLSSEHLDSISISWRLKILYYLNNYSHQWKYYILKKIVKIATFIFILLWYFYISFIFSKMLSQILYHRVFIRLVGNLEELKRTGPPPGMICTVISAPYIQAMRPWEHQLNSLKKRVQNPSPRWDVPPQPWERKTKANFCFFHLLFYSIPPGNEWGSPIWG